MWDILIIFIILIVGVFIGAKNFVPKKLLKLNDRVTTIVVLILLFVMGVSIGINKDLINNISIIGLNGFLYAFFPVLFSILFAYLLTTVLLRGKKR